MDSEDKLLREFFEFRLDSLDEKIGSYQATHQKNYERLNEALDRLASAIVSREFFDELSRDVRDLNQENERLKGRVVELESKLKAWAIVIGIVWLAIAPLIYSWIQETFK